jgi:acyl transferase domain-containing protein
VCDHAGWDPREPLCDLGEPAGPLPTAQAQVCLFAVQYGMAAALREYGVEPGAAVGHSVGELAVAAIAGVLSLPDAVVLAVERGRACDRLAPPGGMVAVSMPEPAAAAFAARFGCALAAVNSAGQCVLSGLSADVDALVAGLTAERVPHTVLASTRPFHSPAMAAAGEALAAVLPGLTFRPPRLRLVSSLTGTPVGDQIATPAYWQRQLVEPVRFAAALAAAGGPDTAYVDLGPGQVLRRLATAHARQAGGGFAAGTHPGRPEEADGGDLTRALARLWAAGAPVRWDRQAGPARRVRLPGHPFEPRRFPVPTGAQVVAPATATPVPSGTTGTPRATLPAAPHDADTESTELVAAIFEEVVGAPVPDLGLSFFDLGGDSLMAVQAAARISDAFGVRIGAAELTQHPSVRQLAAHLVAAADG